MQQLKTPKTFQTFSGSYVATAIIGEGGAGRIYEATDENGNPVAIKVLDPSKASRDKLKRFKNELQFSLRRAHQNIIAALDYGITNDGDKPASFYVMPLYRDSLRNLISNEIPPEKVLHYFGQILDGVEAAHFLKVVHRDLKPENILYDSNKDQLLIADFGIARFSEEELYTAVETKQGDRLANFLYSAPEQRVRGQIVDVRADIFALGLMLNEMFTHEVPQGNNYKTIELVAPELAYLDEIVAAMLYSSPSQRQASIDEVKQQLIGRRNEFITRQKINELQNTVVPVTTIDDDPLIANPVHLVGVDWNNGNLTLKLSQSVSSIWISSLQGLGNYSSFSGSGPATVKFNQDRNEGYLLSREAEVQANVNHFKEWLVSTNRQYEQTVRQQRDRAEIQERRRLQDEIEQQEARERVLKNVKIYM